MQAHNLSFIMIISTIILICSFYLYFPQGLAISLVSPAPKRGSQLRAAVAGDRGHQEHPRHVTRGVPRNGHSKMCTQRSLPSRPQKASSDFSYGRASSGSPGTGTSRFTAQLSKAGSPSNSYFSAEFGVTDTNFFFLVLCSRNRNTVLN